MTKAQNPASLPIDVVLPELISALKTRGQAVLQAPPGAGKTTRVPLAMLKAGIGPGKILMLEPRRLATRTAAERMAESLGETAGETIGYRMRGESRSGKTTRVEVVTEGILTRMIQSDPELPGIAAVIFDEFHERSLQADFGLALVLEIREALREDLILLVMSATLDAAPVAALMGGAPVITAKGRAFPVTTTWLERPWQRPGVRGPRFEDALCDLTLKAVAETSGGVLVFAPGAGEIHRLSDRLQHRLPKDCHLQPLYGAMAFKDQRAAIAPLGAGRKLVLATSIAETSLTIAGITTVVDGGLARRARFDPASGMSRLVTEKASKAEITQRSGRAGRVRAGACYRLWTKGEEGGLAGFAPAEIEAADLSALLLELALWGASEPAQMPFLTQPNPASVREAKALLTELQALDRAGAITKHGRAMARLPLHPRLAHMILRSGAQAPLLAALLSENDPIGGAGPRPPADLNLRLEALRDPARFKRERPYTIKTPTMARIKTEAKRLPMGKSANRSLAEMAALAYPDRIGLRRQGEAPRYILSGGKGAYFAPEDSLGTSRLIVATDLDGDQREARIRQAVALTEAELRGLFARQITSENICVWSKRTRQVQARQQTRFGALVLSDHLWAECPPDQLALALLDGIRETGISALNFSRSAELLRARIIWLGQRDTALPDCTDAGLMAGLEIWLLPYLSGFRRLDQLKRLDLLPALKAYLNYDQSQLLTKLAPASITAPTGSKLAVDYSGDQPSISVRLQEMFGLKDHPCVGPDRLPLLIELLSPARRPVQSTSDLPGFWASSYQDVRKDMRGRYPKHPWPEDPLRAPPTTKRKPRC